MMKLMNDEGRTPLHWAAIKGNLRLIKFLVKMGATVEAMDKSNKMPLNWAEIMNHTDVVSFLKGNDSSEYQHQSKKNDNGTEITPFLEVNQPNLDIIEAVKEGQLNEVRFLIANKAHVDTMDEDGSTPLNWAAAESSENCQAPGGEGSELGSQV